MQLSNSLSAKGIANIHVYQIITQQLNKIHNFRV
jgi:hypothetical protein